MDLVDERFFGAPPVRGGKPWLTREVQLLREHYPRGGAAVALAVLPGRERKAIYTKANSLGLRAPAPASLPTRTPTKYQASDAIDAAIRSVYAAGPKSADLNALARSVMRPRVWIAKRATALGLTTPRYEPAEWEPRELAILESHAHLTYDYIRQVLARQGYKRTTSAIACRVKRLGLDRTDPDNWTTYQLAPLLGVAPVTVYRWITQEGLPAKRKGSASRTDPYIVNRDDLRRWIGAHAQLVDLRKVERYWFIDLMMPSSAIAPKTGRQRKVAR